MYMHMQQQFSVSYLVPFSVHACIDGKTAIYCQLGLCLWSNICAALSF